MIGSMLAESLLIISLVNCQDVHLTLQYWWSYHIAMEFWSHILGIINCHYEGRCAKQTQQAMSELGAIFLPVVGWSKVCFIYCVRKLVSGYNYSNQPLLHWLSNAILVNFVFDKCFSKWDKKRLIYAISARSYNCGMHVIFIYISEAWTFPLTRMFVLWVWAVK